MSPGARDVARMDRSWPDEGRMALSGGVSKCGASFKCRGVSVPQNAPLSHQSGPAFRECAERSESHRRMTCGDGATVARVWRAGLSLPRFPDRLLLEIMPQTKRPDDSSRTPQGCARRSRCGAGAGCTSPRSTRRSPAPAGPPWPRPFPIRSTTNPRETEVASSARSRKQGPRRRSILEVEVADPRERRFTRRQCAVRVDR